MDNHNIHVIDGPMLLENETDDLLALVIASGEIPNLDGIKQLLTQRGFDNYKIKYGNIRFETDEHKLLLFVNMSGFGRYINIYIKHKKVCRPHDFKICSSMGELYCFLNSYNVADIPEVKGAI